MSLSKNKALQDPYLALRNREFLLFLGMRMCTTLAIQMQAVTVGWQVYTLSNKDPLALGMIGLTEAIPAIGVALFAGYLVDVLNRRSILLNALTVLFFSSFCLWFFTLDIATGLFHQPLLLIFFVIFLTGLARGFLAPANFAFMTQIVDKTELPNAIAWSSTNWQVAAVAGPALGGLLYTFLGISATYAIQLILIAGALTCCYFISNKVNPPRPESDSLKEKLFAGIRFVFGHQVILTAISLDLFAVLFGGAVALLPAFAADVLKVGTLGLGFLRAAPSVGAVITAIYLAYFPIRHNAGQILLFSVAGFGLAMIGFALSASFWLSMFFLFLSGGLDSISVVIRANILQLLTPEEMKGRVSAVNSIFIGSSNEIGAFESGVAARLMGLIPSVVFGGCMTLLVVLVAAYFSKALRKFEF